MERPTNATFASMLMGQFHRQPDAVNGRRKHEMNSGVGVRENFVKFAPHRALAGRVSLALNVGRVLKQRQHALLAVFRKGMQIEEMIIRGGGIDLEVASVDDDTEGSMNRERHTIHQTVRHADGMNGEDARFEALTGTDFTQVRIFQKPVLIKLSST